MHLNELKDKKPQELLDYAESLGIENASGLKKQEIYFSVLKKFAEKNEEIIGEGVLETMQDGFGFLRSAKALRPSGRSSEKFNICAKSPSAKNPLKRLGSNPRFIACLLIIMPSGPFYSISPTISRAFLRAVPLGTT